MKRRSFSLALAAAAVVWASGAMEARAGSVLLSTLLGTTLNIGNVNVTFDSYTSTIAPADQVYLTIPIPGTNSAGGGSLEGPFGALPGATNDSVLVLTASLVNPTGQITGLFMTGNPYGAGTGVETVTETVYAGTSPTGPIISQVAIASNTTLGPVFGTFAAPQTTITIVLDLHAVGGNGGASLSDVSAALVGIFPTGGGGGIPEPNSMALLGIGMASLLAFRRLIRRRTPV